MSHEIESDYKKEYDDEDRQCQVCSSYQNDYCKELEQEVSPIAHCVF